MSNTALVLKLTASVPSRLPSLSLLKRSQLTISPVSVGKLTALKVSNRPTVQTMSVEALTPVFLSASELCGNTCVYQLPMVVGNLMLYN